MPADLPYLALLLCFLTALAYGIQLCRRRRAEELRQARIAFQSRVAQLQRVNGFDRHQAVRVAMAEDPRRYHDHLRALERHL